MIGGETGRPLRNSTGPGCRCRCPTAGRAVAVAVVSPQQLVDALEAGLRAGGDVGRLVAMAQDSPIEVRDGDVDARRAKVGDEHVPRVRAEGHLSRRAAAGARPSSSSTTRPSSMRSATRWATTPRLRPVRETSSALDRDRACRISSRIETSASSDSPRRRTASRGSPRSIIRAWLDLLHFDMQKYDPSIPPGSAPPRSRVAAV